MVKIPSSRSTSPDWVRQFGLFGVVVADLVFYPSAGFGLGYWAHLKWNWPLLLAVFLGLIGFGLAMVRIYQLFKKDME